MNFVSADSIRAAFSAAMSAMYRTEVPAYGTLMELVADVNAATLKAQPELLARLEDTDSLDRISEERHGAIRLGTAAELSMMRRAYAVMGMFPVGYYDLSAAGVPVHSTAFRPVADASLKINPFRVFTSLLRLDLIADEKLRKEAEETLAKRNIFTAGAVELIEIAEKQGGLTQEQADKFVTEVLETFRWHDKANVSAELYHRLHDAHRLIADVVSFKGPHINHLTPRTLDIDAVQVQMPERNISPKAVVEGPPTRKCAVLLRQTSFKALEEAVSFTDASGEWKAGTHTARFGEIEQRGVALTPKGRALYDALLDKTRERIRPAPDGSNAAEYVRILGEVFEEFPDTWAEIREQGLGYFAYSVADRSKAKSELTAANLSNLIAEGAIQFDPIVYEDFLPVSAAGIFQSNLGDDDTQEFTESPNQKRFEADLGATVLNEFEHYARIERESVEGALKALAFKAAAE
ncbi:VOC family protein [Bacillus subtilis]|uniref:2-oxoadipate dioxygenase/decarboxylase HglS n=1 Tax=Pseudochrobactrum asaccharolyticum TaxID=354351 RepID=UPI001F424880|nr:VOC family protein [Pseudochrobactrum asaccharolyticum]MCF7646458.1 VOC family protein [Pseudochrobactrum asaccharolyticum]MCF7672240.1 VOC family protein [Bacillus subtilis]